MEYSIDGWLVKQAVDKNYPDCVTAYALLHIHTGLFFTKGVGGAVLRPYPEYRRSPKSFNYWLKRFKNPEEFRVVQRVFSPKEIVDSYVEEAKNE